MKRIYYTLIIILCLPIMVNAETITYNVCKNGCEYSDLETVTNEINNLSEDQDVIINFLDSETYEEEFDLRPSEKQKSLIINGNNASISNNLFTIGYFNKIIINNLNIISSYGFGIGGISTDTNDVHFDEKEYKDFPIEINNCNINAHQFFLGDATVNVNNSILQYALMCCFLADVYINQSVLDGIIIYSGGTEGAYYDSNMHIPLSAFKNKILRLKYSEQFSEEDQEIYYDRISNNYSALREFPIGESYAQRGITKTNNIYLYQEVDKTIKSNTNISEFESEFVNTYDDSLGYNDIKDNPVEWKSENESTAKIENGMIVPVSAGKVDIVGTRNNDIYTIHLTVEKETIPEKIDKMTIKVPITGSKIKLWIIVVSVVLLAIVGTCLGMFIKRKK